MFSSQHSQLNYVFGQAPDDPDEVPASFCLLSAAPALISATDLASTWLLPEADAAPPVGAIKVKIRLKRKVTGVSSSQM